MAIKRFDKQFWLISLAIFFLDQIAKYSVIKGFEFKTSFFQIHLVKNFGAGFGILQDARIFLAIISMLFIVGVFYYYPKFIIYSKHTILSALIFSGALGNLFDRLVYGFVVDFLNFNFWPVFNIADAALTMGIFGLVYFELKKTK